MTREEWQAAHRMARIARRRRGEDVETIAAPAPSLEQEIRRLARHAAVQAARRPAAPTAPHTPRTRQMAALGLLVVLVVMLAVIARRPAGPERDPALMQADAPAEIQVAPPAALPKTQPT